MNLYFNRDGDPIEMMEWVNLIEKGPDQIAYDNLPGGTVCTVWIGLNAQPWNGPPLIFKTMIIEGPLSGEMDRYPTIEAAETGHAAMVARVIAARRITTGPT